VKSALIVDDSALVRRIVRASLEQNGWTVHEAGDGYDGVAKARKLNPEVIVLDLVMPVMNGLETTRQLKRLMPAARLLLFTTYVTPNLEQEAFAAGIHKVIAKSDGTAPLVSHMERLLAENQAAKRLPDFIFAVFIGRTETRAGMTHFGTGAGELRNGPTTVASVSGGIVVVECRVLSSSPRRTSVSLGLQYNPSHDIPSSVPADPDFHGAHSACVLAGHSEA
jgi:CheY-like chemotaxis protein